MKHTTRSGKPLMLMDSSELIDEIAHLRTKYDQVSAKNYRRKKALKQLNKFALVNHKVVGDVFRKNAELETLNENQSRTITNLMSRVSAAEEALRQAHQQMDERTTEMREMATYAHGLEIQQMTGIRSRREHRIPSGLEPVTNTKPSFFRRMFGRTNRVGTT